MTDFAYFADFSSDFGNCGDFSSDFFYASYNRNGVKKLKIKKNA